MILGIDVGNTDTVTVLMDEKGIINEYRNKTNKKGTILYYEEYLKEFLKDNTIKGVIITSVVSEINEQLNQACINFLGIEPIFVSADLKTGINIKYDNPNKLGADLITVAVGAVIKYNAPVIVVDIGTATTFSVINEKKEYLGGMIAPGPYITMKALATMTSQLPEIELTPIKNVIGTNTIDCMKIGTMVAHAAMIDGMIDKVLNILNRNDVKIIATGGRAEDIISMCSRHKIIYDKNLISHGLYELYRMNV